MDDKGHIKMKIKDILNRLDVIAEATPAATSDFGKAFADARKKAGGPNGTFTWNGKQYNTAVKGETPGKPAAKPAAAPEAPAATANAGDGGADQNAAGVSPEVAAAQGKPAATNAATLAAAQGKEVPAETPAASAETPATGAEGDGATPGAAAALASMGKPTTPAAPADDLARMTQLAGAGNPPAAGGYGNFTGGNQSAQTEPAAATAAPAAAPNPDTVAPVVKTGSGGTLTTRDGKPVTSRSNDEIAWAQSHPYQPYPGPGWQEKQKAQGEKNWNAIKNFFGGNKAPAGQATQPTPATAPSSQGSAGGYAPATQVAESELSMIKKLSGLK